MQLLCLLLLQVDAALIKKTAGLAQLEVTDEEADALVPRVRSFLGFVAAMDEVDTSADTAPGIGEAREGATFLREDETRKFSNNAAIMANMPLQEGGYLRVPKVGEEGA
jgi:aspartyl/glutamyl-tRNA(Asn/Gln) amidotransferase C subunit